jgi:hypothetical protein
VSTALIEQGVYELLNHASVTALAPGGVHRRKATQGSGDATVVIFRFDDADDVKVLGGATSWLNSAVEVRAVCEGLSTAEADAAYAAAHTRLEGSALPVGGQTTLYCRRFGLLSYDEDVEGGKTYQHVGGRYRIMVTPT